MLRFLLFMAACCDTCLDPSCVLTAAGICGNTTFFPTSKRSTDGHWVLEQCRECLPMSARSVPDQLLDTMTGYKVTSVLATALEPATLTFMNAAGFPANILAGDLDSLAHAVFIYRSDASKRALIMDRLEDISISAPNDSVINSKKACDRVDRGAERVGDKAKTADDLENRTYPLSRLFSIITLFHFNAMDMSKLTLHAGQFDAESGTAMTTFKTTPTVTDAEMKNRIFRDLLEAFAVIPGGGGRAQWKPLFDNMDTLSGSSFTPDFVHALMFKCLRKIDSDKNINIVTFLHSYYSMEYSMHNTVWEKRENDRRAQPRGTRHQRGEEKGKGSDDDQADNSPVTKQGEWVQDPEKKTRSGAIAYCNRYNTHRDCNVGCKFGKDKGKCMFVHRCSWCDSKDHVGTDKDKVTKAWVCPKHP